MGAAQKKIKVYLYENRPGEFIVVSDWCVHVLTKDRAKQLDVSKRTIELRLVWLFYENQAAHREY